MAGGMTAGRGPRRGASSGGTAAGDALLGRSRGPGGAASSGPSGPVGAPPVEERVPEPRGPAALPDPAELRRAHRHCWVLPGDVGDVAVDGADGAAGEDDEPYAGVVAEWRATPDGWRARVVYALGDGDMLTVVETWLAAEQLRPA